MVDSLMPMMKFFVKGKSKVIHVSLRPNLTLLARDYGLQIACRNLLKENSVEVIVKGESATIEEYQKAVENFHPRLFSGEGSYTITPLERHETFEPDWNKYWQDVVNESMVTGSGTLTVMNEHMDKISGMVNDQQGKFHIIGQGVLSAKESMDKILIELHENAGCIKSIDKSLCKISIAVEGLEGLSQLSKNVDKIISRLFPDDERTKS